MRAALIALACLSVTALPFVPVSQADVPDHVCIPPGTLNQACVGKYYDGRLCAWPNGPSSFGPICVPDDTFQAPPDPICIPPGSLNTGCYGIRDDGAACAWIYGGPFYHYACVLRDGSIESCSTNLYSPIYGPGWHCLGEPLP